MFLNGNSNILLGVSLQKTSLSSGFGVAVLLRLGIFSPMLLLFHSLLSRFVGRNTFNCVTEISSSLSKRGWLITVSKYKVSPSKTFIFLIVLESSWIVLLHTKYSADYQVFIPCISLEGTIEIVIFA